MATTQQQVPDSNASSGIDSEKQSIQYVEDRDMKNELEETGYIRTYADIDEGFDPKEVRRIVRKVDLHLIPILAAMYCISLIDRTNLSMARSANGKLMNKELSLDQGNYYSVATMIFFIPYIILEIPSQLGLRKYGVRWWLATAVILWGIVMMCMGFVKTPQQLIATRALLGIFEASLFPGAAFLIACWYPRKSMALRNTAFYFTSTAIGGMSSILAWGISQMNGTANMAGWRWIFIIEGLLTICIGVVAYFFLQDFPDKATFLNEHERNVIITRIQRDRGDATPDPLTLRKALKYTIDPKIWLFSIMFAGTTLASYSMAFFLPTILQGMGFSNMLSQILYAPPKIWGIVPGLLIAWWGDRTHQRAAGVVLNAILVIVGTCMFSQLQNDQKVARYAAVFLSFGSCTANVPLIIAWAQTSIREQSKRGFNSAILIAFGGVGGILSGVLFIESEAKIGYPTGIWSTIGFNAFTAVMAVVFKIWMTIQNRRADRGDVVLEGHPEFRYQA
ncbi:hypothetical protein A1Q2_03989 [Trichosporon asahii var. asahii CBS 8904]|uniref:Major facilitator superfamily (MFS) profile domain-containing protein n=1 Tax=Trichosporon asahii var. asahii (strain CBS 8904) TaxID=1220162 RepID=K1VQR2_TRIAC|nr:hypothetical protein A1Q2_03989 [Trichosporon asahii var. asahii CBS 8904]